LLIIREQKRTNQ